MRRFCIGNDLLKKPRDNYVIDTFGLEVGPLQEQYPDAYQWLHDHVKTDRAAGAGGSKDTDDYAERWWRFAKPRNAFRPALAGLGRYIGVCRTAKHRAFTFVSGQVLAETTVVCIASEDAWFVGVLSSRIHEKWVLAQKATLETRPRYNVSVCFEPFPFPACPDVEKIRIRDLGERLDAHRKQQQAQHSALTMTGMYNVLEKLRPGEPLTKKEQQIHEQGLVSVLRQIHDDLDAAVFDAYGWPHDLSDEDILQRLVDLNRERAEEERRGLIRWLRPKFQNPEGAVATQQQLPIEDQADEQAPAVQPASPKKHPWPATLREQVRAVREALAQLAAPASPVDVAKCFTRAPKATVAELLATLADVGQARQTEDGRYVA